MKSHVSLTLALVFAFTIRAWGADTWPGFRGTGDSHTMAQGLPWSWELRGSRPGNWTLRLPGYGQSSPIVWQNRVFVTAVSGDEKEKLHVLAVSLPDGKTVWQRDFHGIQRVKDSDTVSRGAPTPVADRDRLYVAFESGDIFALTHGGELVWSRSFVADYGEIKGPHGYASSPVLVNDVCVLQVAHSGPSYILALEKANGKVRWKTEHPSQTGWSTPAVLPADDDAALVISTSGSVRALDARTGHELWNIQDVYGNSTPSPTIAGKYILIGASTEPGGGPRRQAATEANGQTPTTASQESQPSPSADRGPKAAPQPTGSMAIELDSSGIRRPPRIAWKSLKASAGYASPVVLEGLAYFVNRVGVLQCVDVSTGEAVWQHRLPGEVWASPIANHGHVTIFCKHGQVITFKSGREPLVVAESQISTTDIVYGVAAIDQAWIVRSGRALLRITGSSVQD